MSIRVRLLLISLALAAHTRGMAAQYQARTWLAWRTVETSRFSLHFPAELEAWARLVGGKLEGVDTTVSRLVGFSPDQKIPVVIDDPFGIPNGSAWPFIDKPALVLWASPPTPREDVGTFVSWADMLATHEFAHLAHLLRPTRNRWQALLGKLAPVELGPISRKAPRWLIEGYATYIEGVVTKSGRPNGVWRPAILRQWAIEGALPTYSQLDRMGGMYGGEFAYLAGSAFIEWLVARRGEASLVDLWRRMSATTDRGFVEAFAGVYGEAPDVLYGRFTAELTTAAKMAESAMRQAGADTGRTIQHLARETGDPAISIDGGRVVLMLASATKPGRVVIWSTVAEPDTTSARAAQRLRERDSLDVPPYRPFPPPRKALATLHAVGNQSYLDPRFFRDGRVLVWRNSAVGNGAFKPDLYAWDPQRDRVTRLTRGANLRQGDPSPDGTSIAATRCTAGRCDLVVADVRSGATRDLAIGNDTRSYYRPRFSADGATILVGAHDGGFWRVAAVRVADGALRFITPPGEDFFDASYADDSTIVATWNMRAGDAITPTIVRISPGGLVTPLARVTGAAVAPEYNAAEKSVWFLAMHARGWDVRAVPFAAASPVALLAPREPIPPLPVHHLGASTRYSGRRKWTWFPGASVADGGASVTLGLANTDPVGKLELLVLGAGSVAASTTSKPWEGASATLTSRGILRSAVAAFAVDQDRPFSRNLAGGAVFSELAWRREHGSLRGSLGASAARSRYVTPSLADTATRMVGFAEAAGGVTRYREGRRSSASMGVTTVYGRHGSSPIGHVLLSAGVTSTEVPFMASATVGASLSDLAVEQFIIGGPPPTLLPPGVLTHFISMPALPPLFTGKNVEAYRGAIPVAGLQLYTWAGRAGSTLSALPFQHVDGIEWAASIGQIAVLGTPAARVSLGAGRWRNKPPTVTANRWQAYLTTQFGDWTR
ncbi:MAG TPA: hypothetical protein VFO55_12890 [Gemmatimonadaceae bacterium]|nr:hypothetical protein [Gemmatimonadaceae bacterium]